MKTSGATAEVFLSAFKTMKKEEQDIFLTKLLKDKSLREDLIDIAIVYEREGDKRRPFREFLAVTAKLTAYSL
ncbi:MAG: hypothetical protein HZA22_13765 [Nitrospirae bacterium]|nr:hypothetical protein [Nitrospirota bacterium]MBI5694600.1 hypothetical protein [Nitrospirota bacterium]